MGDCIADFYHNNSGRTLTSKEKIHLRRGGIVLPIVKHAVRVRTHLFILVPNFASSQSIS